MPPVSGDIHSEANGAHCGTTSKTGDILTNGSKLMWLEGFSSNNRLEYFKTCYKPCLGHSGLDGRLRNNVMFQSLVAVILRKVKRLLFLSTFILFFLTRLFSPKTVLVFALDFYFFFLFLETGLVRECSRGWA